MNELIHQHTLQSEYRSNIDEVLRKGILTKSDLFNILTATNQELFRLDYEKQQNANKPPQV